MSWPTAVFASVAVFSVVALILGSMFAALAQRSLDAESKKREEEIRKSRSPYVTITPEDAQKSVDEAIKRRDGQ